MNMTPCFISEMPGEKTKALLIGFYQKAWTHDASPLIGGFPAGQIATRSRLCCSNRAMLLPSTPRQ